MTIAKSYRKEWVRLPLGDKWALVRAGVVLLAIGSALRVMSYARFKKIYNKFLPKKPSKTADAPEIERITWSVKTMAHHLPMTLLCLPQALTTKLLLGNTKDIEIKVGVNREKNTRTFEAHAWVTHEGKIIIGELETAYQPLWTWN